MKCSSQRPTLRCMSRIRSGSTMTERIVFLDRSAIPTAFRRPRFPHVWQDYADTPPALVVDRLRDATIAITNRVQLKEDTLVLLPKLRLIAVAATGHDIVDLDACDRFD